MLPNNPRLQDAIIGAVSGAVGWLTIEALVGDPLSHATQFDELLLFTLFFGALAGIYIGGALGMIELIMLNAMKRALRGGMIGAGMGLLGGAIGLGLAEIISYWLPSLALIGCMVGWALFGAFVGAAKGIIQHSSDGLRHAALGGAVGGAIGGVVVHLLSLWPLFSFAGNAPNRALMLIITGALVGFWIAWFERKLARATLKITSGPFAGRDVPLNKAQLKLGRNKQQDIIIPEAHIWKHHATLIYENQTYMIQAEDGASLSINGRLMTGSSLAHQDEINLGKTRLIYCDQAKQAKPVTPPSSEGQSFVLLQDEPMREEVASWAKKALEQKKGMQQKKSAHEPLLLLPEKATSEEGIFLQDEQESEQSS